MERRGRGVGGGMRIDRRAGLGRAEEMLEPLNQYLVKGGDRRRCRSSGYDLTEGGRPSGQGIVATPEQAADAAREGLHGHRAVRRGEDGQGRAAGSVRREPDLRLGRLPAVAPEAGALPGHLLGRRRQRGQADQPSDLVRERSAPRTRTSSRRSSTASRATARTSSPTRSACQRAHAGRRRQARRLVRDHPARA